MRSLLRFNNFNRIKNNYSWVKRKISNQKKSAGSLEIGSRGVDYGFFTIKIAAIILTGGPFYF
jgi:hypothetical protein